MKRKVDWDEEEGIGSTCAELNSNHANYKIIDLNVMDWANVIKIHTPPICQTLFSPLTSMRCTKIISRPGMENYRKSLLA